MKQRITIFLLLTALLMAACSKDDFMELRHPIVMEGEFDPVFGIPVAKMSADVATMVGMLDFNQDVTVYIGEDDIVSFRYYYNPHFTMSWTASKDNSRKGEFDTIRSFSIIEGTQTFDLFEKLEIFDTDDFSVNEFLVTLDADVKGFVNSSFHEALARGANLTFDSLVIVVHCLDGYSEELPLLISSEKVRVSELIETRNVAILDHYNLRTVVEHRPTSVDYTVRMCITIPTEQMAPGSDFAECMETLGVDSMMCDLHACLELPLNFYSRHITYFDTIPLNLSNLEDQLDNIGEGVINGEHYTINLNDSNCYLAFVAKNHIPVEAIFNCTFLDEFGDPILSTIFDGDRAILPAPTIPLDGHQNTWCSNGATETQFKIHLSLNDLKQLCNTRRLHYSIELTTANQNLPGIKPFVAVKMEDKIDIRSYAVLSPHADFSIPLELPSFSSTK